MTTYEFCALGAAVLLLLIQARLIFSLMKALRRIAPLEERIGHLSDALTLLTETSESGFRAVALEVERLGHRTQGSGEGRTTTARVASAARRGHSVQEIAAEEQVSESEVRLRLHMAEQAKAAERKPRASHPPVQRVARSASVAAATVKEQAAPAPKLRRATAAAVATPAPVVEPPPPDPNVEDITPGKSTGRTSRPARNKTNGSVRS
jgi:hypothetical protein